MTQGRPTKGTSGLDLLLTTTSTPGNDPALVKELLLPKFLGFLFFPHHPICVIGWWAEVEHGIELGFLACIRLCWRSSY